MVFTLVLAVALMIILYADSQHSAANNSDVLRLHCAAGMKNAVEPATRMFTDETGIEVEITYGGSGVLLADFRTRPDGVDLFLAADDEYTTTAYELGLIQDRYPLARMRPVIAVKKGNPLHITSLSDLTRDTVRVALAHPDTAAIGRSTQRALTAHGYWDEMYTRARVCKPTVNELANDLKLETIDAAITWDATARQYDEIDFIDAVEFNTEHSTVCVGISSQSRNQESASLLAKHLASEHGGRSHFTSWGYSPLEDPPTKRSHSEVGSR